MNTTSQNTETQTTRQVARRKFAAAMAALFIGWLGMHKFYLGRTRAGVIQIFFTILTLGLGAIVPFIEGIIYLTKSDAEFEREYVVGTREWF